jgi:DNA recombination protein RmuC
MTTHIIELIGAALIGAIISGILLFLILQRAQQDARESEAALARKLAIAEQSQSRVNDLTQTLLERGQDLASLRAENSELVRKLSQAETRAEEQAKQADEKLKLLAETRESMTREFRFMADEVMVRHTEAFSKQNKEQIDVVLAPLREKLSEFQQGLQNAHTESAKERATLAEQIRQLSVTSGAMTSETINLTRALKGKAQTQGAWGEMILATILERSGLREGEEYLTQESFTAEAGQRLRPDVIVNLPGGQKIVIDSKVSLTAFEAHVNAESDADAARYLADHVGSLRGHIRGLNSKSYAGSVGSELDYVIMFVPIEGALAVALNAAPDLTSLAAEQNVAIATPTTLMIALRTVANVWRVERRNQNAEDIAKRAGALYDKFVGFMDDMGKLKRQIDNARDIYDEAEKKLSAGKGNLVNQVELLKKLGAKTSKSLPPALLTDIEDDQPPLIN